MIYPLLSLFLSLIALPITTVLSLQPDGHNSHETDYNHTSVMKQTDDIEPIHLRTENEWKRLRGIILISAVAGIMAFFCLCCVCGLRAACSPQDKDKRKYLSHA